MKFAVFGDIHGNLQALKAAFSETVSRGIDKIYHLGDLGGYAPSVNEVVEFLIEHGIAGVQGNYDETVANDREHCGCKYEDPAQEQMANLSFEWTKRHASRKTKEYLKQLPFSISLQSEGKKVLLFHATPGKNNLYWYEERPEKFFLEMAGKVRADVMIYGHTHKPYRKDIGGKVFINAGSVGKPKDGDSRACVLLVDISKEGVITNFLRVPYNIEATAEAIIERGFPGYFAERLKEAR